MKIDFENELPVWVWGILFVLVVLPFSFRRSPEQSLPVQTAATLTVTVEAEPAPLIAVPTATVDPAATESIIIEIAPAPRPADE